MDGDIAPLDKIVHIAQEYDAMTYFDDAHGSGVLGKNGRGAIDHYDLTGKVDFTVATISKAISSVGGYVVGSKYMRDWVTGGALGALLDAVQSGVARGIFSNEAGLGSAPIAAAAAKTKEPIRQRH